MDATPVGIDEPRSEYDSRCEWSSEGESDFKDHEHKDDPDYYEDNQDDYEDGRDDNKDDQDDGESGACTIRFSEGFNDALFLYQTRQQDPP